MNKKKLIKILTQHRRKCKFKDTIEKALFPFIVIEPSCMADEILKELNKENGKK